MALVSPSIYCELFPKLTVVNLTLGSGVNSSSSRVSALSVSSPSFAMALNMGITTEAALVSNHSLSASGARTIPFDLFSISMSLKY